MSVFTEGSIDFFLNEPGAFAPPASQPTEPGSLSTWGDLLRRVATLGHAVNNMSDTRAKVDAMCDADPFDACLSSLGALGEKHKELIASNPPRIMHQLPCRGDPWPILSSLATPQWPWWTATKSMQTVHQRKRRGPLVSTSSQVPRKSLDHASARYSMR